MNELQKTLMFVAVAAALGAVAFLTRPQVNRDISSFVEERAPFYPDVQPENVKGLEVTAFDDDRGQVETFAVKQEGSAWVIPSHNNYPADAEDQLKETAGAVLGLQKDAVVAQNADLHAEYGVVDPLDSTGDEESWGTRVKLFDSGGNVVSDLIVGKEVTDKTDFRFVRVPEQDRVYQVKCTDLELTTRFADWINTDLIEDSSFDFDHIEIKDYRLERVGNRVRINDQGVVDLSKNDENKWTLAGLAEGESTDETKASDVATAISDLSILGVRPKPAGLTPDLNILEAQFVADSMIRRGFYPTEDGRIVSNEGEVICETDDGLQYTLRFGGVFIGRGEEVEAGSDEEKVLDEEGEEKPADAEAEPARQEQENRFLLVSVAFNEERFPPIEVPNLLKEEEAAKDEAPAEDAEPTTESAEPPAATDEKEKTAPAAEETTEPPADAPAEDAGSELENIAYQEAEGEEGAESEPASKAKEPAPAETTEKAPPAEESEAPAETAPEPSAEEKAAMEAAVKAAQEADAKRKIDAARREYEANVKDREQKIEEGRKKAAELEERYGQWFYVVSNEQATKIRLTRDAFVKKDEPAEGEAAAPPAGIEGIQPPAPPTEAPAESAAEAPGEENPAEPTKEEADPPAAEDATSEEPAAEPAGEAKE